MELNHVIEHLLAHGYEEDGKTREDTFKLVTQKSYPLPGAIVTMGGRLRFKNGDKRVTVGKRVVCFYEIVDGQPANFNNIRTADYLKSIMTIQN